MAYVAADMVSCGSLESVVFVSVNLPETVRFPELRNLPGNTMTFVTDPIGDLLARMRNAQHVGRKYCRAPHSKIKVQLCELLKKEGWIADIQIIGEAPKQDIEITFIEDKPKLELKRVSKPGRRVYQGVGDLKSVLSGFGMAVLTTSQGLMTDSDARKNKVGGEVLCTVA